MKLGLKNGYGARFTTLLTGYSAETSGGLLLALPRENAQAPAFRDHPRKSSTEGGRKAVEDTTRRPKTVQVDSKSFLA